MLAIDWKPDAKKLRTFGVMALVVFGALGALALARGHVIGIPLGGARAAVGAALCAVGALAGVFAFVRPALNRPLYLGLTIVTYPIGIVVSYAVLGFVFYGVFSLVGLIFRLLGRDPLARRFEADRPTYWIEHPPPKPARSYFRQF
jgi:hypothetical protein